ncbi:MAG TPA: phosphoribosylanthranilate isomerase, partial [Archaeoglobaceae archaeon]|nr:phosphoribosylanthranilate isomerase [Archaeoglobaceae archaeon]
ICGVRDLDELKICIKYADAVGFVTEYPVEVPWNISREKAKQLISKTPPFVYTVVVTAGSVEKVLEIAEYTKANAIQLHGNESEKEVEEIVKELDAKVIKALQIDLETGKIYNKNPIEVAKSYARYVDAVVLDSKTKNMPAGTGKPFNWEIARKVREKIEIPLILAGGLNSRNVKQAIEIIKPHAVDVISGVETNGKKDEKKIREFIIAAKVIK